MKLKPQNGFFNPLRKTALTSRFGDKLHEFRPRFLFVYVPVLLE